MITVTQLPNKKINIKAHYFYRERIKSLPTALFVPQTKEWTIEPFVFGILENKFQGELVYKTPRWVITVERMPDMSKMYQITDKSIKSPELKIKPYDYQDYGIRFMIDKIIQNGFCLNSDSVGLGKTLQSIGVMKWFIDNKNIKKVLIICKKSIKMQWINEINKFTDLKKDFFLDITGSTAAQRRKSYKLFKDADKAILVTNYHSFLNDTDIIKDMGIDFAVVKLLH